jgi:hypothetical protein
MSPRASGRRVNGSYSNPTELVEITNPSSARQAQGEVENGSQGGYRTAFSRLANPSRGLIRVTVRGEGGTRSRLHDYALYVYSHAVMPAFAPVAVSNSFSVQNLACASTRARP